MKQVTSVFIEPAHIHRPDADAAFRVVAFDRVAGMLHEAFAETVKQNNRVVEPTARHWLGTGDRVTVADKRYKVTE